jgi:hypothetical protein
MNSAGGEQDWYIGLGVSSFVVIVATVLTIAARIAGQSRKATTGRKAAVST